MKLFGHVVASPYDPVPAYYDCTYRNFVIFGCGTGLAEGGLHIFLVITFHYANIINYLCMIF